MVTEDQIQAILETEPDPQGRAERLVRAANRAGGIDNITVVVLDVRGDRRGRRSTGGAGAAECRPAVRSRARRATAIVGTRRGAALDRRPGGLGSCSS